MRGRVTRRARAIAKGGALSRRRLYNLLHPVRLLSMRSTSAQVQDWCEGSCSFLKRHLSPFLLGRSRSSSTGGSSDCCDMSNGIVQFGCQHPVQFVALSTFLLLGGMPLLFFLAYIVGTLIACVVGALVFEAFLVVVGLSVLIAVLLGVLAVTGGVASLFAALYYSYRFASFTAGRIGIPPVGGKRGSGGGLSETDPIDIDLDEKNK